MSLQLATNKYRVPLVPSPPTIMRITSDTIELSWEPPLFSSSGKCYDYLIYVIEEKDCIHSTQEYKIVYGGTDLQCRLTGRTQNTNYSYRLKYINSEGSGPHSSVVHTRTKTILCDYLHDAILRNDTETVMECFKISPDHVNVTGETGKSPLMVACEMGMLCMVDLLLKLGAEYVFSTANEGRTSFGLYSVMVACYYGHNECAKLINSYGTDWMTEDRAGMTALDYAIDGEKYETVEMLLAEGIPVNYIARNDNSKMTTMLKAAIKGNAAITKLLIAYDADINMCDSNGRTPLMLASKFGNVGVVEVLVSHGARLSFKDTWKKTALDYAMNDGIMSSKQPILTALRRGLEKESKYIEKTNPRTKRIKIENFYE